MSGKGAKGLAGKGAKGTMHGADKKSLQDKKKPTSRSARAGLQFPVGRVHRLLKVGDATGAGRALPRGRGPGGSAGSRGWGSGATPQNQHRPAPRPSHAPRRA